MLWLVCEYMATVLMWFSDHFLVAWKYCDPITKTGYEATEASLEFPNRLRGPVLKVTPMWFLSRGKSELEMSSLNISFPTVKKYTGSNKSRVIVLVTFQEQRQFTDFFFLNQIQNLRKRALYCIVKWMPSWLLVSQREEVQAHSQLLELKYYIIKAY